MKEAKKGSKNVKWQVRIKVRNDFSEVMTQKLRFEGLEREDPEGISNTRDSRHKSTGTGNRTSQSFERPVCWDQGDRRESGTK